MPYHSILTAGLLSLIFPLLLSTQVRAEVWLTDSSYLESQHYLAFNHDEGIHTLSQLHGTQVFKHAKIQFSGKLSTDNQSTDNQKSESLLNQAKLVTAPLPYFSFTLGRFLLNYRQEDLFKTSLGKNQDRMLFISNKLREEKHREEKHYNQGLLSRFQLGFIGQELSINQSEKEQASYHYRLKIGVPGYKFGPLDFIIEQLPKGYLNQPAAQSLALLGGSLSLPMPSLNSYKIPGAWQWSFQLGKGLKQSTQAWQTSMSWLGFIPKHKFGLMWAETDKGWVYSSDFDTQQSSFQARYQITLSQTQFQTLTMNATAIQLKDQEQQKKEQVLQLAIELSF